MYIYEVIGIIGTGEGAVQGITPPGSNGIDFAPLGYSPDVEDEIPAANDTELMAVWVAQTNLLNQQSAYLDDIKATFMEKRAQLPVGFSMENFVNSDIFKLLAEMAVEKIVDWITDFVPGQIDDIILDGVSKYGVKLLGAAIVWLQKMYYAGSILCDRMREENTTLVTISPSWERYATRSDVIKQHDLTIQSLMAQVSLAETQIFLGKGKEGDMYKQLAFEERVFECPYTGLCLGEKNGIAEDFESEMVLA